MSAITFNLNALRYIGEIDNNLSGQFSTAFHLSPAQSAE